MRYIFDIRRLLGLCCVVLSFLVLTSCDEDNDVVDYKPHNVSDLVGEWVCIGEDGEYTVLNLENNHTVKGESLLSLPDNNKTVTLSGIWFYYKNGNVLKIEGEIDGSLQRKDYHYSVRELGDNSIVLLNQEVSSLQTYRRVKSHIDKFMGEKIDEVSLTHVYNDRLINPETNVALNPGICFIEGTDGGTSSSLYYVNILHRSEKMMNCLSLSIDEIMEEFGTPDVTGQVGQNQAVLYKIGKTPEYLSNLQIHYDLITREVTRILAKYSDIDDFMSDYEYFLENYNSDGDMFYKGNLSSCLEADKVANPIIDGASGFMSYINMTYYITHGYF